MYAERTAIFKAISSGETEIVKVALVTDGEIPSTPCGACRQVMIEFGNDFKIIMGNTAGKHRVNTIKKLLPDAFKFG
jgi:cytidine deaminase